MTTTPRPRRATQPVVAGRPLRDPDAPLNPPVVFASTFVGSADIENSTGYGRYGNPTWTAFEEAVGALEGGPALAFASGMAASNAVFDLMPTTGTTVVAPRTCYQGVVGCLAERALSSGWTVRTVDIADTAAVLRASEGADLLWLESPTNPTLEVADLPALGSALAALGPGTGPESRARPLVVVDNTFATPLLQRPIEHGADLVVHSATKFLAGHSDVILGVVACRPGADEEYRRLLGLRSSRGAIAGPMETFLALRGLRTLAVRLDRAQESALILATRLSAHPAVRRVRYPGLPDDPCYAVATRTMDGYGAVLSIELADAATADRVVSETALWTFATSLGGVESTLERRRRWPGEVASVPEGLIRLAVGIEHVDDLWEDLAAVLDRIG